MLKICLVIPTLQPGGMERVMSELAGYFAEKPDTKIDLVLYGRNRTVFYELPDKVAIHRPDFIFDNSKRTLHTIKTLFFLRRKISRIRPDIVLSFGEYWNSFVLLSLLGKKVPVVVSDRCSPDKNLGSLHERLRRWIYPKAAAVIAQTSKASKIYKEKGLNKSIPVIGNPIREIQNEADGESARENVVLTVGRLIETKHHDRLIRIFSEIGNRDWKLVIVGDNALKQDGMTRLQRLISELDLEGRVILTGNVKDVDEYYLKSKIFAFTSSSEGFPNVIGEALSAGLPVVSYNCSAGPEDMIRDGKNGFLVETFEDNVFRKKLELLMNDEKLRLSMQYGADSIQRRFNKKTICDTYLELLSSFLPKKNGKNLRNDLNDKKRIDDFAECENL